MIVGNALLTSSLQIMLVPHSELWKIKIMYVLFLIIILCNHQMTDIREKQYEAIGIGSSYLFRVDDEHTVNFMLLLAVLTLVISAFKIHRTISKSLFTLQHS